MKELDLWGNSIKKLPLTLLQLDRLKSLDMGGNSLDSPFDYIIRGNRTFSEQVKRMRAILQEILEGISPCVQGKVILLGDALAGKTTLLDSLNRSFARRMVSQMSWRSGVSEGTRTVGVNVKKMSSLPHQGWQQEDSEQSINMPKKKVFINCYDFAGTFALNHTRVNNDLNSPQGQEEYFASHQLFLSSGALFFIVFDLSQDKNLLVETDRLPWSIEKWTRSIQCQDPSAQAILVGSKIDKVPRDRLDRVTPFMEDMARLMKEHRDLDSTFPQVIGWEAVSGKEGKNIMSLKKKISGK